MIFWTEFGIYYENIETFFSIVLNNHSKFIFKSMSKRTIEFIH